MTRDAALAERFRDALGGLPGISEKRMMGGTCFLLDGNMLGATNRDKDTGAGRFMFRIGKKNEAAVAGRTEATPMVHGNRRMGGFFYVAEEACTDTVFAEWIAMAVSYTGSLPPKG